MTLRIVQRWLGFVAPNIGRVATKSYTCDGKSVAVYSWRENSENCICLFGLNGHDREASV